MSSFDAPRPLEDKSAASWSLELEGVRRVVREELRSFAEEFRAVEKAAPPTPGESPTDSDKLRPALATAGDPRLRNSKSQVSFLSVSDGGVVPLRSDGGELGSDQCVSVSTLRYADDVEARARQQFAEKFRQDAEESGKAERAFKTLVGNNSTAMSIVDRIKKLHKMQEPEREGCLAKFVTKKRFEGTAGLVILLNCGFMVASANYQVEHPGSNGSSLMQSMEIFFLTFYSLEVVLKLIVHRWFFFWNEDLRWNLLDLSLVIYGYFDILMGGVNITWLRSLRLFRMAKVLRVLRIVKSFKELRLILSCLMGSITNLIWSIVMIAIIVFMFSLVFVQQTAAHLADMPAEDREAGHIGDFETVERSMLSLYAAATGGQDWLVFYQALQPTGDFSCMIFLFFVAFIQIAVVNILTGIFVEKALKRATPDMQTQARDHRRQLVKQAGELRQLCEEMDEDHDNTISRKEFFNTKSKNLKDYLKLMGLNYHDISELFKLLSGDDDKKVPIEEFVRACMRLKTGASVDIQKLLCEWGIMMSHVRIMEDSLERLHLRLSTAAEVAEESEVLRSANPSLLSR
jgi:voltage-gated sodium channel